ncbi:hypothetical protein [Stenotrophomonas lactitubi]|uniref:hypothetical protein n=1 Tax=Stenotrophomonas lactitubi TaxID=2045214 RepID=UPI0028993B34|nr:hypothetical protein [Stenotrophomonas lactitubi]
MSGSDSRYITRRDAAIAAAIWCAAGAIIMAMVLTGSRIPLKCFEGGNAADWTAAVGTWVIGVGAIRYSASELGLKLHERREKRYGEVLATLGKYADLAVRARLWDYSLQKFIAATQSGVMPTDAHELRVRVLAPLRESLSALAAQQAGPSLPGDSPQLMQKAAIHAAALERAVADFDARYGEVTMGNVETGWYISTIRKHTESIVDLLILVPDASVKDTEELSGRARSLKRRIDKEDEELTSD